MGGAVYSLLLLKIYSNFIQGGVVLLVVYEIVNNNKSGIRIISIKIIINKNDSSL